MDNFNNSDGFMDDNWQKISYERHKSDDESVLTDRYDDKVDVINSPKKSRSPVLSLQLILTLCLLLFLFVMKFLGLPLYDVVIAKYNSYMSESVIYDGDFNKFDFSFLNSTADEI